LAEILLKCLEGLFISCQEINEISKSSRVGSSSTNPETLIHEQIIQSIDSSQRMNDIYLFLINILLIVQDPSLLEMIQKHYIHIPAWYKEKTNLKVSKSLLPNSSSSFLFLISVLLGGNFLD
jgi:hypothetical protein